MLMAAIVIIDKSPLRSKSSEAGSERTISSAWLWHERVPPYDLLLIASANSAPFGRYLRAGFVLWASR